MPQVAQKKSVPSAPRASVRQLRARVEIPWRERPQLRLATAAEIAGVSEGTLYRLANEGRLTFVRLGGRTLVDTGSLITLIASREQWTPSDRGSAARAHRSEVARAALRA